MFTQGNEIFTTEPVNIALKSKRNSRAKPTWLCVYTICEIDSRLGLLTVKSFFFWGGGDFVKKKLFPKTSTSSESSKISVLR